MPLFVVLLVLVGIFGPHTRAAGDWIAGHCVGPQGALMVRPGGEYVSGYFGNITAEGLAASGSHPEIVRNWMTWYLDRAHGSGSGVDGVPDDGRYVRGVFVGRGRPDSTDAYGATFILVAQAAYESGDPGLRALVEERRADMLRVADSMLATLAPMGLTYSRPQHQVAYAIDNEQVYAGLIAAAALWRDAYQDPARAQRFTGEAARLRASIEAVLWEPITGTYRPFVTLRGGPPADLQQAYPGALAQVMAVVYGVVDAHAERAVSLVTRAAGILSAPAHGDAAEYREVLRLAEKRIGAPVAPEDFSPPPICSDAGWYLLENAAE